MNKTIYKVWSVSALLLLLTVILMQGCSKVEDNLVTAPKVTTHPDGWVDTNATAFHGKYLFDNHMNLVPCAPCHGADFKGGTSGISCYKCHNTELIVHSKAWMDTTATSSPYFHKKYLMDNQVNMTVCKQCHGDDYKGGITNKSCYNCHNIATIHNGAASGWENSSDTVNFHGRFIMKNGFNIDNMNCKNCHGTGYDGGVSQKTCYSCHDNGPKACYTCHGDAGTQNIWPPKSLFGHMLNTEQGVGAHNQHLNTDTTQRMSAIVQCSECHTPVNNFSDPNHLGTNPGTAEINFGTLAKTETDGVIPNPVWNASTKSCSSVYCHGTFKNGNQNAAPVFNTPGSVVCGSCHGDPATGNPTPGGDHTQGLTINDCSGCHTNVMNPDGTFLNRSLHINGAIDFSDKKKRK
jgi:predicted CxxxxCH...CXXCH cytochrome family protein